MALIDGLCTCQLYVSSKYSDLCLLTGAHENGPIQKLTNALTIQRVLKENTSAEGSPALQLFHEYLKHSGRKAKREKSINLKFLKRGRLLFAQNVDGKEEDQFLEEWYKGLWKGLRQEIELNVLIGTQILFKSKDVALEDFLQYFVNLLSISALAETERREVVLAAHCFMAAEP